MYRHQAALMLQGFKIIILGVKRGTLNTSTMDLQINYQYDEPLDNQNHSFPNFSLLGGGAKLFLFLSPSRHRPCLHSSQYAC